MRKWLIAVSTVVVLAVINAGIWQREAQLQSGTIVLLELAPVDPRALMQGDYMRLAYHVARDAFPDRAVSAPADGRIVVAVDDRNVATFRRRDDGAALAANELALRYRRRGTELKFATDAYFFEEGHAADFAGARYGEFRVAGNGEMILVGLRDKDLQPLSTRTHAPP
jgi:uncharacterized membrane-anchored protein